MAPQSIDTITKTQGPFAGHCDRRGGPLARLRVAAESIPAFCPESFAADPSIHAKILGRGRTKW
jgi:hypothetical protein